MPNTHAGCQTFPLPPECAEFPYISCPHGHWVDTTTFTLYALSLSIVMEPIKVYHHFKTELIDKSDRVSLVERAVHDLLMTSKLADVERESTVCWELKHSTSTAQFARVLARKRNLPIDICSVGMMLHDIYSMIHGTYKDHAHRGAPLAMDLLKDKGGFSDEELDKIYRLIYHHSDKHVWSDDPLEEFGKDVDVLDCFLYEGAFDFYLGNKPLKVFVGYLERAKRVWRELGIPQDLRFNLLNSYSEDWFGNLLAVQKAEQALYLLNMLSSESVSLSFRPPPFLILQHGRQAEFWGDKDSWTSYHGTLKSSEIECLEPALLDPCRELVAALAQVTETAPDLPYTEGDETNPEAFSEVASHLAAGTHAEARAVLFWPVVGIYELLEGDKMKKRLEELGVVAAQHEKGKKDVS